MGNLSGSNDSDRIPVSALSDTVPMANDASKIPTSRAVYAVEAFLNSRLDTMLAQLPKTYVNGVLKTNQRLRWVDSTIVAGGSGLATFNITSDRTSTGTAMATSLDLDSVTLRTEDGTGQYALGAVTSPNVKTVVVAIFKQVFGGVVLLSTNLLGSVSNNVAPNGTVVKITLDGDAA